MYIQTGRGSDLRLGQRMRPTSAEWRLTASCREFNFEAAVIDVDDRDDYGEVRFRAVSFLDGRLFTWVFADIEGSAVRAISLRKATKEESKDYANS